MHRIEPLDLIKMDDLVFFKLLMSGGDDFPGMYRISLKHQPHLDSPEYLKVIHLFDKKRFQSINSAEDVLEKYFQIIDQTLVKGDRNDKRSDEDIKRSYPLILENYLDNLCSITLCALDNIQPVTKIEVNSSYYFMGSIIHFSEDSVKISYHHHNQTFWQQINISYETASKYINQVFNQERLSTLFFRAETIGEWHLRPNVKLEVNDETLAYVASKLHLSSLVIASPTEPRLPIEFSKPIFLGSF